ncbi:MAG: hypothetical protein DRJ42_21205 [Deltaproteobacteria bacterium]|nr:MAG: hypothetical protein DRJ42_21205 [Deltaproteobacteria bacterium]
MTSPEPDRGAIGFAEKLLMLLDEGHFTATYKYAVLLSLMDLCLEQSTKHGAAPSMVTTRQLAEKVVEMYWPHAVAFGVGEESKERVLFQNRPLKDHSGGQAAIVREIVKFRSEHAPDPSATITRARHAKKKAFEGLVRRVEWKLVEMPLPRLQLIGEMETPFIYQINWDRTITKKTFNNWAGFDNAIRFMGPASEYLVQLAGLLRPLIQRQWAAMVARFNTDIVKDAELERFLFGVERISLAPVRNGLRDLQDGRCFYCESRLGDKVEVDHFVPWARYPNNAIENLVIAHSDCNQSKGDHLASADHVQRWAQRLDLDGSDGQLREIADAARWEKAPARSVGVARSIYLRLPGDIRLWQGKKAFRAIDRGALEVALSGGGIA